MVSRGKAMRAVEHDAVGVVPGPEPVMCQPVEGLDGTKVGVSEQPRGRRSRARGRPTWRAASSRRHRGAAMAAACSARTLTDLVGLDPVDLDAQADSLVGAREDRGGLRRNV